jgi:DNA mismatch repair protein MutS
VTVARKKSSGAKKGRGPTPMMAQYLGQKAEHPDALLLFRMGDFYETFYEDARVVSEILGITLTSREKQGDAPIPLAGIPYHALDQYLIRLLDAGHTVAICEQTEDPSQAKGLVRREVVEVVSPGTITNPALLRDAEAAWLLAVAPASEDRWGWALLDSSTGEFLCASARPEEVANLPRRYPVAELLVPDSEPDSGGNSAVAGALGLGEFSVRSAMHFDPAVGAEELERHFALSHVRALGLEEDEPAVGAAGAALGYLAERQRRRPAQVHTLRVEREEGRLFLDRETIAHLELFSGLRGGDRRTSLFFHVDRTCTPMGRRRLAAWLRSPLANTEPIEQRLDAVEWGVSNPRTLAALRAGLKGIGDLERILGRIATARALPHEIGALRDGLLRIPGLLIPLEGAPARMAGLAEAWPAVEPLAQRLDRMLVEEPPNHLRQGGVFRDGVDEELDRLRGLNRGGKAWIAAYQEKERERTGIPVLKVGFNKVFGYHVEVSNKHLAKVPAEYVEKQRLAGGKRFVTPQLQEREREILDAEERMIEAEARRFARLVEELARTATPLARLLDALGVIDVVGGLAHLARERGWSRPTVEESGRLEITEGRHPVVEQLSGEPFVPNDLRLDAQKRQILLLTGPNMGGKSTYLRQTALIVLLAQAGSFVPAARARVGLVDRLFTRVGASDDLARGQSTFLVEMAETAKILRGMTPRSLLILDEVGRGTSTRDGLAIARAITEYLHEGKTKPRTLFATHFHELTEVADRLERAANARLEVREWEGRILFLHRVVDGASDRSYGVHVAELAGVPVPVLARARELMEDEAVDPDRGSRVGPPSPGPAPQLGLFAGPSAETPIAERLRELAIERIRPVDALVILSELVELARDPKSGGLA